MKPFFLYSTALHGLFLASLITLGALLSKPRMSYYAVDLMGSPPAGGVVSGPSVSPAPAPTPKVASAPKMKASAPVPAAEEEVPANDTIRLLAKLKKKRLALAKSQVAPAPVAGVAAPSGAGRGGIGLPGSGAGIVADAGPAFPYPWYLKAIADRLDKQWKPPQEFQSGTFCWVTFLIGRSGDVSESQVATPSGDSLFDQLALRAVLYANPLPPLPNGFPDDTLKVHMKFVGRRL
jgi:TonB family protein